MYWKALPRKTLAPGSETSAPGFSMQKQRLSVLVCSNASGDQKLTLAVIGKSKNPRALKGVNIATLPPHYYSQKNEPKYFQIGLITFLFQM